MPSMVIRKFRYDANRHRLQVEFVSGRRYEYYGVPLDVYRAMRSTTSRGMFFNTQIRDRYPYVRLGYREQP